jgi:hypothetical protein
MTIRRPRRGAPLAPTTELEAALRSSREAICDVEGQLDALLAALRDPTSAPDASAADRLHGASNRAGSALASLSALVSI